MLAAAPRLLRNPFFLAFKWLWVVHFSFLAALRHVEDRPPLPVEILSAVVEVLLKLCQEWQHCWWSVSEVLVYKHYFYPLPERYSKTGFHSNSFLTSENTCKNVLVGRFKAIFPVQTPFQVCSIYYSLCFSPHDNRFEDLTVSQLESLHRSELVTVASPSSCCVLSTLYAPIIAVLFFEREIICNSVPNVKLVDQTFAAYLFFFTNSPAQPISSQRGCLRLVLDLREFGPY